MFLRGSSGVGVDEPRFLASRESGERGRSARGVLRRLRSKDVLSCAEVGRLAGWSP